ncbi:unnamed protein product [Adineta ricciae]|uniref:Uncharacterized protein n=1 Tax=Adineta ricciae TaxID=249248 RepID=A0A814CHH7_ADIRI|nr:unnamed protein product [Adineta ricciae]CAF1190895.1 unnamed protein product [Adineta ricciae]
MLSIEDESLYCPPLLDNLCWPQTLANDSVTMPCASLAMGGVDPSKFVTRRCLPSGNWANVSYKPCVYPDVWELMMKFYIPRTVDQRKTYTDILQAVRIIELIGLSVSFVSVLVSLLIFLTFRSLYCSRTKIHINLLLAIFIQIVARIVNYGIEMKQRNTPSHFVPLACGTNASTPSPAAPSVLTYLCPLKVVFLQFSISAMFMWMLCEGIHLNNVLTVSVFKNHFKTYYFYIIGWIVPFCITLSWSIVMFLKESGRKCWANYNYLKYYYIVDGPRYAVMIINVIFLLNIIRVLLVKIKEGSEKQLRDNRTRRGSMNTRFVRKAVKAAVFLLPLLGITHMLETFVSPDRQSIPLFALYCSVTYFLVTFQGFFCSLLYCFLNTEVRDTVSRRLRSTHTWTSCKQWLGRNDRYEKDMCSSADRTRLELLISRSVSRPKESTVQIDDRRLTTDVDDSCIQPLKTTC